MISLSWRFKHFPTKVEEHDILVMIPFYPQNRDDRFG